MLEIGGSDARVYFLLFRLSFRLESWERADGMTFVSQCGRSALLGRRVNPRIKAELSVSRPPMPENPNRAEVARRVEKAEKLLQKGKTADALADTCKSWKPIRKTTM